MNTIDLMLQGATWTPISGQPATGGALHATHSGVLDIPGFGSCKCWRLSNGQATLDAGDMARLFGFGSPEELAADIERLGNGELAAKLRKPIEFTTTAPASAQGE
jgi:hypothetical protein